MRSDALGRTRQKPKKAFASPICSTRTDKVGALTAGGCDTADGRMIITSDLEGWSRFDGREKMPLGTLKLGKLASNSSAVRSATSRAVAKAFHSTRVVFVRARLRKSQIVECMYLWPRQDDLTASLSKERHTRQSL